MPVEKKTLRIWRQMFEKLFWSANEEGAGIFGFANLSNFWFGTHTYQLWFSGFGVLFGLWVFSNLFFVFDFCQQ